MFRVPYRWLPRTFFTNIHWMWLDIKYGVYNIIRWTPVIWHDADFDWEYLAHVMEYKLRRMSKNFDDNKRHVGYEKTVRECLVCAELLKRMTSGAGGVYYKNAAARYPDKGKRWADLITHTEECDVLYLCKQMRKIRKWWD